MSEREIAVLKSVLEAAKALASFGLVTESILHGEAQGRLVPRPTLEEFEASLTKCDNERLLTSARNETTGRNRWMITDLGRTKLRDL